jgi:hypothetical protein
MKRRRTAGWLPNDSKADREAADAIRFLQIPLLAWSMGIIFLPLELLVFWGTWNPWRQICFSAAALIYPFWIGINGWVPWKMAMLRTIGGIDPERWQRNPTANAVADFVQTTRVRWTAAAIAATGALNPWLITGISAGAGGTPFNDPKWLPASGAAMFGAIEGLRSGTLAIRWIIRQIRQNWTRLREGPGRTSADAQGKEPAEPGLPESMGEFLQQRNVTKSTAISWYLAGLVILGSLAYLRGCLRRHG